jgi:hypothetical protein
MSEQKDTERDRIPSNGSPGYLHLHTEENKFTKKKKRMDW